MRCVTEVTVTTLHAAGCSQGGVRCLAQEAPATRCRAVRRRACCGRRQRPGLGQPPNSLPPCFSRPPGGCRRHQHALQQSRQQVSSKVVYLQPWAACKRQHCCLPCTSCLQPAAASTAFVGTACAAAVAARSPLVLTAHAQLSDPHKPGRALPPPRASCGGWWCRLLGRKRGYRRKGGIARGESQGALNARCWRTLCTAAP